VGSPASIPAPDFGHRLVSQTEKNALPFGATDRSDASSVVVHFKVLSVDPSERLAIARMIENQLASQRVGAKGVLFVITDEAVESMLTDISALEKRIEARIMKTLGLGLK
jgi:hypothetical protein